MYVYIITIIINSITMYLIIGYTNSKNHSTNNIPNTSDRNSNNSTIHSNNDNSIICNHTNIMNHIPNNSNK